MSICKYCNQEIEWRESKRTGKPYTVNIDGSLHKCPKYNEIEDNDKSKNKPEVTTAGDVLDDKNIENAKWFIDGLNLRLVYKRIELLLREKEAS